MPDRTHIPALTRDSLIVASQKIDRLAIPEAAKRLLRAMLTAAADPYANKIEIIIKTLPKARQDEIYRVFDEVLAMQQANENDAAKALLLLGLLTLGSLLLTYLLTVEQEALQAAQLFEINKRTWVNAIQDEIDFCGCKAAARQASGSDLETLRQMATEDTKSIVATYNRDAQRHLEKLFKEFPNAGASFFIESMKEWVAQRSTWKLVSIAFNTEARAREYARARFREMNFQDSALYKFVGPTPVCKVCVKEFAAGFVTLDYVQNHPCPRHPNCPHQWRVVRKPKVDCRKLWVG